MIGQNSAPNCTKFPAKFKKFVWIDIFHPSFEPRDVKKTLLTSMYLVCIWNLVVRTVLWPKREAKMKDIYYDSGSNRGGRVYDTL